MFTAVGPLFVPCDQETGNNQVIFMQLDLASLKSVRSFAENFLRSETRLDLLINNAGQSSTVPVRQISDQLACFNVFSWIFYRK